MHARPRRRGQRRFGASEKGGGDKSEDDDNGGEGERHGCSLTRLDCVRLCPASPKARAPGGDANRPATARSPRRAPGAGSQGPLVLDIPRDETLPDAMGQNEGQASAGNLLVLAHGGEDLIGADIEVRHLRDLRRQPDRAQMRLDARRLLPRAKPEIARKSEGASHADRNPLAVDEALRM